MRRRNRFLVLSVALLLLWSGLPALVRAQGMNTQGMNISTLQKMPELGTLATPSGSFLGTKPGAKDVDTALSISDTYVNFIDSALPRNVVGLRFDAAFNNRQPMRSEYYHPKGGLPGATGFPFVETRIDYQELSTYAEYAWTPWFSVFMEAPYRWLNPEINANQAGASDVKYGLKLCTWSSDGLIATILLRLYQPVAAHESLGTGHWSIEPGLLVAYRVSAKIHLEGEFRYWIPLGGSDFAGDLLRYGVGVSYGQRKLGGIWFTPVAECIGWTVLSGKTMITSAPDRFVVQEAHGQTIVNGYLGVRFGNGRNLDFYVGYGRSFTGEFWQREIYRFEMRYSY